MQIILATPDATMAAAWSEAFSGTDASIYHGSILEVPCDALVSPANSFGFMDGGLDLAYSQHFGWDLQMRLRRQILEGHSGELLVGAAEVVETGKMVPGLMIAAPTMRVPMRLPEDSVNSYLFNKGGSAGGSRWEITRRQPSVVSHQGALSPCNGDRRWAYFAKGMRAPDACCL